MEKNNKKLLRPYWDIDLNFNFYFEFKKSSELNKFIKKLNFNKNKYNIYNWKNKKILFLNIVTFGTGKNGGINNLRICIPKKSWTREIDFVLGYHQNTKLFFLFEKSVITKVDTMSSLTINLFDFFYWEKFGNFKYFYQTKKSVINKRLGNCWIFKEKNILFNLLNEENINIKDKESEKYNLIVSWTKKQKNLLKLTQEHTNLLNKLNKELNDFIKSPNKKRIISLNKRINQNFWRNKLLNKYKNKCLLTSIDEVSILQACHIKPYKNSERKEQIDSRNGIIMTPTIHKFFDEGFFTFDNHFKLQYSSKLNNKNKLLLKDSINNKKEYSNTLKKSINPEYLNFHRKNIFKK